MHKIQFRSSFKNTCFVENLQRAASDYVRFGTVGSQTGSTQINQKLIEKLTRKLSFLVQVYSGVIIGR